MALGTNKYGPRVSKIPKGRRLTKQERRVMDAALRKSAKIVHKAKKG